MAKNFKKAISIANKALEIDPNLGDAYITLANIYVAGANQCGNSFQNQTVYWIAVDNFSQALKYESTKEKAMKGINTYSKYFPSKEECFFNGNIKNGQKYFVECWVNRSTTVRTSD